MNTTVIMNKLTLSANRAGLKLKKHSPEILAVAGVIGTVASAVMACKATTKISGIVNEHKETVKTIHETVEKAEVNEELDYSVEDSKKDLTIVYAQTGLKLVKLYAPSVILGTLSIGAMLTSNNILRKRNVALAAAYTTIDKSFKEYRGRVVERFGKDLDRELRYNIKSKEVEEVVVNEDGTETVVTKTVDVADPNTYSDYAKFFDETCVAWEKDPEYNLAFLTGQQAYANDILQTKGHLFLNEVYDLIGIPRTRAGQVVGWVYDEKNPVGDNFVDFGIFDVNKPVNRNFVNGYERSILLDFNVDGNILDLI